MFSLFDWLKIGAGILAGVGIGYATGHWQGKSAGYDKRVAEVAAASVEAELKRKGDDALLQNLSDYDLCVAGLSGSGMSVDACEQLRGLDEE